MQTNKSRFKINKTCDSGAKIDQVSLYKSLTQINDQNLEFETILIRNGGIYIIYVRYGKLRNESSENWIFEIQITNFII